MFPDTKNSDFLRVLDLGDTCAGEEALSLSLREEGWMDDEGGR